MGRRGRRSEKSPPGPPEFLRDRRPPTRPGVRPSPPPVTPGSPPTPHTPGVPGRKLGAQDHVSRGRCWESAVESWAGACRPFGDRAGGGWAGARPSYSQGSVLRGARSQRLPPEGAVELGLTLRPRQLGWGPGEGAACLPNNLPGDELLAGPGPHSKKQGLGQTHGARKVLEDEGAAWSLWQPCRGSVQTLGVLGNNRTTFFRKPLFSSGVSMLRATAPVPR